MSERFDFFISYSFRDSARADEIVRQLQDEGYTVAILPSSATPGQNFVAQIHDYMSNARFVLALVTESYLRSPYATAEWMAAWAEDPLSSRRKLIPIRLDPIPMPGLLSSIVYVDLSDISGNALDNVLTRSLRAIVADDGADVLQYLSRPLGTERNSNQMARIWRLPLPRNHNFAGRRELLADVGRPVEDSFNVPIVALTGMGGVGKTQTALEHAYGLLPDLDVVWWVTAEESSNALSEIAQLTSELERAGRITQSDAEDPRAAITWLERHSRWLLVLDNAESPGEVIDFIPRMGQGQVIITSRYLAWDGIAKVIAVQPFSRVESIAYLQERTADPDENAASELAELLGGLPLALEQAAALVVETQTLGLAGYLDQFERRRDALVDRGRLVGYERTLATVWDISFEKIDRQPESNTLLNLIAFLAPDDIPIRTLLSGAPAPIQPRLSDLADPLRLATAVAALRNTSLVTAKGERLTIHRLVQDRASARLNLARRKEWVSAAVELVGRVFPADGHDSDSWPVCERLIAHALQVTKHARDLDVSIAAAADLLKRAAGYLGSRGGPAAGLAHAKDAAEMATVGYAGQPAVIAEYWEMTGGYTGHVGQLAEARRILENALDTLGATSGTPAGDIVAVKILRQLAWILVDMGHPDEGLVRIEQALLLARRVLPSNDPAMERLLDTYGWILFELGLFDQAKNRMEDALRISEEIYSDRDPRLVQNLDTLADALIELGDLDGASEHLWRAQHIATNIYDDNHPRLSEVLWTMARLLQKMGQIGTALVYANKAVSGAEAGAHRHPDSFLFRATLGEILVQSGKIEEGVRTLRSAKDAAQGAMGADHPRFRRIDEIVSQYI